MYYHIFYKIISHLLYSLSLYFPYSIGLCKGRPFDTIGRVNTIFWFKYSCLVMMLFSSWSLTWNGDKYDMMSFLSIIELLPILLYLSTSLFMLGVGLLEKAGRFFNDEIDLTHFCWSFLLELGSFTVVLFIIKFISLVISVVRFHILVPIRKHNIILNVLPLWLLFTKYIRRVFTVYVDFRKLLYKNI